MLLVRHRLRMRTTFLSVLLLVGSVSGASALETGHYVPGIINIRDFLMPSQAGVYGSAYNFYYQSGRLNDRNGEEVGLRFPTGDVIDPDVDAYVLTPVLTWVTDWKLLGARYGSLVAPSVSNTSLGASTEVEGERGTTPITSQFGLGDLYVQPLWLGWRLEHGALSAGWGFYAPTGKYHTEQIDFGGGPVRVPSLENIGLGFWTNQFQAAGLWFPFKHEATAVSVAGTYEVHSEKEDFHLTPGNNFTLNWGVSQYLPLPWFEGKAAEIGVAGYDSWQVTSDQGSDAPDGVLDQVHAAGFQLGIADPGPPWALNFHYLYEYQSEDRLQGHVVSLNASIGLW